MLSYLKGVMWKLWEDTCCSLLNTHTHMRTHTHIAVWKECGIDGCTCHYIKIYKVEQKNIAFYDAEFEIHGI